MTFETLSQILCPLVIMKALIKIGRFLNRKLLKIGRFFVRKMLLEKIGDMKKLVYSIKNLKRTLTDLY